MAASIAVGKAVQEELIQVWVSHWMAAAVAARVAAPVEAGNDIHCNNATILNDKSLVDEWRQQTRDWIQNNGNINDTSVSSSSDDEWVALLVEEIVQQARQRVQIKLGSTSRNTTTNTTTNAEDATRAIPPKPTAFSLLLQSPPTFFVWANLREKPATHILRACKALEYAEDVYQDWDEIRAFLQRQRTAVVSNMENGNNDEQGLGSLYLDIHIRWYGLFRSQQQQQQQQHPGSLELMVNLMDNMFHLGCKIETDQTVWEIWWYMWMDSCQVLFQQQSTHWQSSLLDWDDHNNNNNDNDNNGNNSIGSTCFRMVQTIWQHSLASDSNKNNNNNPVRFLWKLDPTAQWFGAWFSLILTTQQRREVKKGEIGTTTRGTIATAAAASTNAFLTMLWRQLQGSSTSTETTTTTSSRTHEGDTSDRDGRLFLTAQWILVGRRNYHQTIVGIEHEKGTADDNHALLESLLSCYTQHATGSKDKLPLATVCLDAMEALFWFTTTAQAKCGLSSTATMQQQMAAWQRQNETEHDAVARLQECLARYLLPPSSSPS